MLASHTLSFDRFLPMVGLGILLGWLATRSQSIWPGVLVRALMLGVPQALDYFKSSIPEWQAVSNVRNQLPFSWTAIGFVALLLGVVLASYAFCGDKADGLRENRSRP
jgi:membrane protease YdiL (CAAX protease family)